MRIPKATVIDCTIAVVFLLTPILTKAGVPVYTYDFSENFWQSSNTTPESVTIIGGDGTTSVAAGFYDFAPDFSGMIYWGTSTGTLVDSISFPTDGTFNAISLQLDFAYDGYLNSVPFDTLPVLRLSAVPPTIGPPPPGIDFPMLGGETLFGQYGYTTASVSAEDFALERLDTIYFILIGNGSKTLGFSHAIDNFSYSGAEFTGDCNGTGSGGIPTPLPAPDSHMLVLYSSDGNQSHHIAKLDSAGTILSTFQVDDITISASGFTFGPDGHIYVGGPNNDPQGAAISRYNADTGRLLGLFARDGYRSYSQLVFGQTGDLYTMSSSSPWVSKFDGTTGDLLFARFTDSQLPSESGQLGGITISPSGELYVSDAANNEIRRYDPVPGARLDTFSNSAIALLDEPRDMTFGPDGFLYVLNTGDNYRGIAKLASNGRCVDFSTRVGLWSDVEFGADGFVYGSSPGGGNIYRYDLSNDVEDTYELFATVSGGVREIKFQSLDPTACDIDFSPPFGIVDLDDINTFVSAFVSNNPIADLDGDGLYSLGDVTAFVTAYTVGCAE